METNLHVPLIVWDSVSYLRMLPVFAHLSHPPAPSASLWSSPQPPSPALALGHLRPSPLTGRPLGQAPGRLHQCLITNGAHGTLAPTRETLPGATRPLAPPVATRGGRDPAGPRDTAGPHCLGGPSKHRVGRGTAHTHTHTPTHPVMGRGRGSRPESSPPWARAAPGSPPALG